MQSSQVSDQKGAFVAIESPLESYGARQAQLLKYKLELAGYEVAYYSFPQNGEPSSYFAERYSSGEYDLADDSTPYASSLFFALDHFEAAKAIRQDVASGKIVIAHKYLGANMVEQGAKLRHPGERRGYFLWLDNLETRVLGAIRPDKTFILTLSSDHAANLAQELPELSTANQAVSLEDQSRLYSELCDVYPKDFVRVDGERNGKALSMETTTDLLWGLTEPLLPVKETPIAEPEAATKDGELKLRQLPDSKLPVFETSFVVTALLERQLRDIKQLRLISNSAKDFVIPTYLDKKLQKTYKASLKKILVLHKELVNKVGAEEAQLVLPLAMHYTIDIQASPEALQQLIVSLLSNTLPESWELGQQLLKASRELDIAINAADVAYHASNSRNLNKLSGKLTPQVHAGHQGEAVVLASFTPRNELDLAARIIYPSTNLSLQAIEKKAEKWSYDERQSVLQAALGERNNASQQLQTVFDDVRYTWDIVADYRTFQELQKVCPHASVQLQELTPRYGFAVSETIEKAEVADLVESCFDLSTQLHSQLQAAGYELEAAYATLQGHQQRGRLICGPNDIAALTASDRLKDTPLVKTIAEKLDEKHSTIASAIELPASMS
jgi:thymidylate kinase